MRHHFGTLLLFCLSVLLVFLAPIAVQAESHVEYTVQIKVDGSAIWSIRQVGTAIQVSPDTFSEFRNNVTSLMKAAIAQTERNMTVTGFKYTADVSDRLVVVRYQFEWSNFSKIEKSEIDVGDVFEIQDFFRRLLGDGELYLVYPSSYVVTTVFPEPDERNDTLQKIGWIGTVEFGISEPRVSFKENPASFELVQLVGQNATLLVSIVLIVSSLSAGYYMFVFRHKTRKESTKSPEPSDLLVTESDEDRIVKLLKASAGGMHQSAIVDKCKFSKAKTSQLLAILEGKSIIRRYKKGRDKIVVLVEPKSS